MTCNDINIRDPFVVVCDGKYYLYGTICYRRLSEDLTEGIREAGTLFSAASVKDVAPVLGMAFEHQAPLIIGDGGHGMIFRGGDQLYLTFHSPNASEQEHPRFVAIEDRGDHLEIQA